MKYVLMILCACLFSVLATATVTTASVQGADAPRNTYLTPDGAQGNKLPSTGCEDCDRAREASLVECRRSATCNGAVSTYGTAAPVNNTGAAGNAEAPSGGKPPKKR